MPLEDVLSLIPDLNWAAGTSRPRFFQLRGIGEVEQYQGAPNPSVGFLIDDIDFSGVGMPATLFDTQQIEVLRGPQGTGYGANALAGLIYNTYTTYSNQPGRDAQVSNGAALRLVDSINGLGELRSITSAVRPAALVGRRLRAALDRVGRPGIRMGRLRRRPGAAASVTAAAASAADIVRRAACVWSNARVITTTAPMSKRRFRTRPIT